MTELKINFSSQAVRHLIKATRVYSSQGIQKINLSPEEDKIIDNMLLIIKKK
jgi:hypothetical protein